ncbi:hypothetical protein [Streptomyces aureus]
MAAASRRDLDAEFADYTAKPAQDSAVSSIPSGSDALAEGRVATLLLSTDRSNDPLKWSSPSQPLKAASSSETLAGDEDAFEMSAALLLLRAAVLSDAEFSKIPENKSAPDGCAATLRYQVG